MCLSITAGFKSGGFSDVETVRHKDDLANDLLQVDDVVQSAVIVVNGRDAGKVVGGSDKFILSLDNWVMVHSGVKYTGTCFSLPLAPIISEFGLNTTDEFSLVLGLKTVEGTQYIVQVPVLVPVYVGGGGRQVSTTAQNYTQKETLEAEIQAFSASRLGKVSTRTSGTPSRSSTSTTSMLGKTNLAKFCTQTLPPPCYRPSTTPCP